MEMEMGSSILGKCEVLDMGILCTSRVLDLGIWAFTPFVCHSLSKVSWLGD